MQKSRQIAITALNSNPLVFMSREQRGQLSDPEFDINLLEIGMDSLGRMELSIWLEIELGMIVPLPEIEKISTLSALVTLIDTYLGSKK